MDSRIFELKMQGLCCSQMIMQMTLENLDKEENPDLIAAMAGLCNGIWEGKVCGTLTAAICVLYMVDPEEATLSLRDHLTNWFYDTFGSLDCQDLVGDNPLKKVEVCPEIIERTHEKLIELLGLD